MNCNCDDIIIELSPEGQDGRSVHPMGEWSSETEYRTLDLVSYQGSSYIALKTVPVGTLPTDTEYWMVSALAYALYWGNIQGELSDQTDLRDALDAKADAADVYTKTEADALLADKADKADTYTKTETDALLALKADQATTYTKTETDSMLSAKADADTVYTKTETDTLLTAKADVGDSYTKAETDTLLDAKADADDVYSKTETDALLADKADVGDSYTKTEADALLAEKADADDVYTKTQTDALLSAKADTADLGGMAYVNDAPSDDKQYVRKNGNWAEVEGGSGGGSWGTITGTLSDQTDLQGALDDKADVIISSASGAVASFSDGAPAPVTALTVGIEPVQDLHGYDAPWPAGGGKNLFQTTATTQTFNETTFTVNADGTVKVSGTPTAVINGGYVFGEVTLPAGTYKINGMSDSTNTIRLSCYNVTASTVITSLYNNQDISFTLSAESTIRLYPFVNTTFNENAVTFYPMVRLSSVTDATFAPYANICPISGWTEANIYHEDEYDNSADPEITVSWQTEAGTVYSGTLNVTTGVLTVNYGMADLGSLSWQYNSTGDSASSNHPYFYASISDMKVKFAKCSLELMRFYNSDRSIMATHDAVASHLNNSQAVIGIRWDKYTTIETFTDAVDGTKVIYELATPLTYTLTEQQLSLLKGVNNVWADTGSTTMTYRADTKLYIDGKVADTANAIKSMIATTTTTMTAPKNLDAGDLIIVGDELRKATANIGSGSAITAVNSTTATLADVIKALQQ